MTFHRRFSGVLRYHARYNYASLDNRVIINRGRLPEPVGQPVLAKRDTIVPLLNQTIELSLNVTSRCNVEAYTLRRHAASATKCT